MMYQTKKSNMIKKATLRDGLTKHTVMNFINHISISRKIRFNCSKNGRSSDLHHSRTAFPFFQTVAHLECSQTFGAYSYGFSSWFSQDSLLILPKRTVNFAGAKIEIIFDYPKNADFFLQIAVCVERKGVLFHAMGQGHSRYLPTDCSEECVW